MIISRKKSTGNLNKIAALSMFAKFVERKLKILRKNVDERLVVIPYLTPS